MKQNILLTILLVTALAGRIGALEWYRSTASGIPGSPISGDGPEAAGWSLSIEFSELREVRSLYFDAVLQSSTIFHRNGGRLTAREEFDGANQVLSRVEYAYDSNGNPRAIFISSDEEPGEVGHVESDTNINADGQIRRHTGGTGGDWMITDLDSSGQPLERTVLVSGAIVEKSSWNRSTDGTLFEEIHRIGDEVRISRYDTDGRLIEDLTTRNGSVVLIRSYQWTRGNLTRVEERGEGRTVIREINWSGGRIVGESRKVDGLLESEVVWESPEQRIETFFRDGKAVIRVYWNGDLREREEFLRDGAVVRIREDGS